MYTYSIDCDQIYHQVDLIIPFRDIMIVEKPSNRARISDLETQSALVITTKDQVRLIDSRIHSYHCIMCHSSG
jgi:hypothetical protein